MNSSVIEMSLNVPFTPSPIDFSRRRQPSNVFIKRLQSTLPIKRKLTYISQQFYLVPSKDSPIINMMK
jgi:hypothetical protein